MEAIWVAPERGEEEDRKLAGKADTAQQQWRVRQAVDQPGLGHGLHPCADERDQLSAEEQLEIAVAQGAQGGRPSGQGRGLHVGRFSGGGICLRVLCFVRQLFIRRSIRHSLIRRSL
jgi:hypothetical protein